MRVSRQRRKLRPIRPKPGGINISAAAAAGQRRVKLCPGDGDTALLLIQLNLGTMAIQDQRTVHAWLPAVLTRYQSNTTPYIIHLARSGV